jgi:glycosyltransferase involved in cell wall biosynthesis
MPLTESRTAIPEASVSAQPPLAWHVITCEYPPQSGGVSDYVYLLAKGLASRGDHVHIWCPAASGPAPALPGVEVSATLGRFSITDLGNLGRQLAAFPTPRRLLVQWVPHGFGYRALNVPFCIWLRHRARLGDTVDLMVHEPFLPFVRGKWKQNAAAIVQRFMTRIILGSARRVWLSTPAWEPVIRPYDSNRERPYEWLPLPSTVPEADDPEGLRRVKERYKVAGPLLGHFGTFGPPITPLLRAIIPPLLQCSKGAGLLLIGPNSAPFRDALVRDFPDLESAVFAVGQIAAQDPALSLHLSACDLLLQPYPDGVTGRRTSIMAALAHGRATVTNTGPFTEPLWAENQPVALAPAGDTAAFVDAAARLIEDPAARAALGESARAFYRRFFDIEMSVAKLRRANSSADLAWAAPVGKGSLAAEKDSTCAS